MAGTYEKSSPDGSPKLNAFGVRHIQVIMLFFLVAIGIGTRVQLSVAVVAMTDNTTSPNPDIPTYNWTNKSVILSSFYWCYFILQIGAGALGKTYGNKKMLLISMGVNTAACAVVPLAAEKIGSFGVMACRMLQGLSQGCFYPCMVNLLGKWCPKLERSRLGSIAFMGGSFGVIVTQPIVGYLSVTWWGWPSTFYLYAATSVLWMLVWAFYGADSPNLHKSISKEEKRYIEDSQDSSEDDIKFKDIPWKPIFTSIPLWSLTLSYFGQVWIGITMTTELPTYMNKIMKFDVATDGFVSSLPDFVIVLLSYPVAYASDYIIKKKYASIGATRISLTVIPIVASVVAIFSLTYLPQDAKVAAIFVLVLTGALSASMFSGNLINHIDLSPKYSGIIMSISNSSSMMIAPLAPLAVQAIVTNEADVAQWRTVFIVTLVIVVLTHVMYLFYGSGEVQWWNFYGEEREVEVEETKEERMNRRSSLLSIPIGI